MTKANLIAPYGGKLVNLIAEEKEREDFLPTRQSCPPSKSPCAIFVTWNFLPQVVFHL